MRKSSFDINFGASFSGCAFRRARHAGRCREATFGNSGRGLADPIRALQGLGEGAGFRDSPPPPPRQIVNPEEVSEHPFRVELRTAFEIGFLIYIPFIVIDMVVASVLMSMGMMMLPPTTISMPFKILLFVLADGWALIIGQVVQTFY